MAAKKRQHVKVSQVISNNLNNLVVQWSLFRVNFQVYILQNFVTKEFFDILAPIGTNGALSIGRQCLACRGWALSIGQLRLKI